LYTGLASIGLDPTSIGSSSAVVWIVGLLDDTVTVSASESTVNGMVPEDGIMMGGNNPGFDSLSSTMIDGLPGGRAVPFVETDLSLFLDSVFFVGTAVEADDESEATGPSAFFPKKLIKLLCLPENSSHHLVANGGGSGASLDSSFSVSSEAGRGIRSPAFIKSRRCNVSPSESTMVSCRSTCTGQ
jgi:hypothetical protein